MLVSMKQHPYDFIDPFLTFLLSVRGYSAHTVESYATALSQMQQKSECYVEENRWILDIMPLRLSLVQKSKKTIALRLSAIRSFVAYLADHQRLTVILKGDASIKVPQTLPKPIEVHHIEEVLSAVDTRERLLISLLYGLGLRVSELSGLKVEQLSSAWIEVVGKGRKSRQIPLLPSLQQLLSEYLEQYRPKRYLFEKGAAPLNPAQLRYRVEKCFKAQGIKATPHQLRHSFATHLLHEGARISDVSELLGHSSMATTQVYTKLAGSKKLETYLRAHPLAKGND